MKLDITEAQSRLLRQALAALRISATSQRGLAQVDPSEIADLCRDVDRMRDKLLHAEILEQTLQG